MSTFKQFSEHYAVLAFILTAGLGGLMVLRYNPELQEIALWSTVGGYILWGIGHHLLRKDLKIMIVLEYFLVALMGGLVIQATLLQR